MKETFTTAIFLLVLLLAAAHASAANFTVTRTDDRSTDCVSGTDCSLREAVQAANAAAGLDTIYFAGNLNHQTITLTDEIIISGDLIITGPAANLLTIDGGAGTNRIFFVSNVNVAVTDVTLTGGNGAGADFNGSGGAIMVAMGSLALNRVHVSGNQANIGGGVYFWLASPSSIKNSTFSANHSNPSSCGGLYNNGGTVTVVNSTFTGNTAFNTGGALCAVGNASTTSLRNVTIAGNTAGTGGGIHQTDGALTLANTIVAGNTGTTNYPELLNFNGTTTSLGNNLIGDSVGDSTNTETAVAFHPSDLQNVDPMLGALANNGGPTPTRALLTGSPAIDRGGNAQAVDPSDSNAPLTRDQRGYLRIVNGNVFGVLVDIGAYEFSAAPTAASVFVSGRVVFNKKSVSTRAVVTLTDALGNVRNAAVNPFGFYKFEDVSAGQTYIVQISAKGAFFQPQIVTPHENVEDLDFPAL